MKKHTRQPIVAGNWKMHGTVSASKALLHDLVASHKQVLQAELVVFPSFPYLTYCSEALSETGVSFGAQNVSAHPNGAFTGEVSASMLVDLGCEYVIIGHSERRQLFGETNEQVAEKCLAAFQAGLKPILCVGELLSDRQNDKTLKVVQEQLEVVLLLHDNCANFSDLVIAYEPVWAIGTGLSATPEQAQAVHKAIREQLRSISADLSEKVRVLYGGSVKPNNAKALFEMPDIDGALVGGASLDAQQFIKIGQSCNS